MLHITCIALLLGLQPGAQVYLVASFVLNSTVANVAMRRPRIFILAMHTQRVTLTSPLATWRGQALQYFKSMPTFSLEDALLDDEAEAVHNLKSEMISKKRAEKACDQLPWARGFQQSVLFREEMKSHGVCIPPLYLLLQSPLASD